MNRLAECSPGPWKAVAGPTLRVVATNRSGFSVRIASVQRIGKYKGGTEAEARANHALYAASLDHALTGWAMFHGGWIINQTKSWRWQAYSCSQGGTPYDLGPDTDAFGFPILTPDLRNRLWAEMEEANND